MLCLSFSYVCVGDAAVGKSALSHMFHSDGTLFQKNYSLVRALTQRKETVASLMPGVILPHMSKYIAVRVENTPRNNKDTPCIFTSHSHNRRSGL